MTRIITGTEMLSGRVSSITKARRDLVGLQGKVDEMQADLGAAGGDIIYLQPKAQQQGLDDEVKEIQDTIRVMDAEINELKGIITNLMERLDLAAPAPMPLAEAINHAYNYAQDAGDTELTEALSFWFKRMGETNQN